MVTHVAGAYLGIFGSPYINVLQLNEALAKLKQSRPGRASSVHAGAEPRRTCASSVHAGAGPPPGATATA